MQASVDVKERFNPTNKFFTFCLHSYVTALALQMLSIDKPELIAQAELMTKQDLTTLLDNTSKQILEFEWHNIGRAFTKKT